MPLGVLGDAGLHTAFDRKTSQVVGSLNVPTSNQNASILQSHSCELLEVTSRLCHTANE